MIIGKASCQLKCDIFPPIKCPNQPIKPSELRYEPIITSDENQTIVSQAAFSDFTSSHVKTPQSNKMHKPISAPVVASTANKLPNIHNTSNMIKVATINHS